MKAEEEKQGVEEEVPISEIMTRQSPVPPHKRSHFTGASGALPIVKRTSGQIIFSALHIREGGESFYFYVNSSLLCLFSVLRKSSPVPQPATGGCHNGEKSPVSCRPRPLAA